MSLFGSNWRNVVTNLLPARKRTTSLTDWIVSLIWSVSDRSTELATFESDIRTRVRFNGRHLVLAEALNKLFGVTGIRVETRTSPAQVTYIYNDVESFEPVYIYNAGEGKTLYIYNDTEMDDGNDFVVLIPIGVYTVELDRQVSAEVRTYKLAGKSFVIETY
jgi:hypothetical protein